MTRTIAAAVVLALLAALAGCIQRTVYISTQGNPAYAPLKQDPILVALARDATDDDRRFMEFLKSQMQQAGFVLADNALDAKYLLMFETGTRTRSTGVSASAPTAGGYTVRSIKLELYAMEDVLRRNHITAWEGYAGAGESDYLRFSGEILRALLDAYGTSQQSYTPIDAAK